MSKNTTASKRDIQVHDGLSPTQSRRLIAHRLGVSCPAQDSTQVLDPRSLIGRAASPLPFFLVCLFMLESHECSSWESASGKKTGRSEVRVIRNSLFLGSASHVTRPGK